MLVFVAITLLAACREGGEDGLPAAGSEAYEQTVRRFHRGLAQLEVGLLDAAIEELRQAAELAPEEPAVWADLALAHGRLGDWDEAGAAIDRAAVLAPESGRIAFMAGRLETARGRRDEGIALLRRAVELDPDALAARSALVAEVEAAGGPDADDEAQKLLEELVERQPDNLATLVDRARLAAKRSDAALLDDSVRRLGRFAADWPPTVAEQYRAVEEAAAAGDFSAAARAMAFLRNVLVSVPDFLDSRARISSPAELISEPLTRFLRLPEPVATPSPADRGLTYTRQAIGDEAGDWSRLLAFPLDGGEAPVVFAAGPGGVRRVDADGGGEPLPGGEAGGPGALLAVDWDNDFRLDLLSAGESGVRLLLQSDDGSFRNATEAATASTPAPVVLDASGAWAADVDMDGDVDVVIGVRGKVPTVLRNNGDGTWLAVEPFTGVAGLADFAWGDVDDDGDPDAVLVDGGGGLRVFANRQAGRFEEVASPAAADGVAAVALADVDADGALDLVTLGGGTVRRASRNGDGWSEEVWATWEGAPQGIRPGAARLLLADLDNNGALDLVAAAAGATALWLADEARALGRLAAPLDAEIHTVTDLDGDGLPDLVGLAAGRPMRFTASGPAGYHFHTVRPRAVATAGDQRINSFGLGGTVEVRAGLLVQKQPIAGPAVHFGLGERTAVDVTRVVWPNGVAQGEFDPAIDRPVVAEQRLKGSCPWVFADDGSGMRFVTDFLWRSPLGLRINASDTAGVTQTEDWVKLRGDQLAPRDGAYDVRITAELWETHFIDHVALLVVDRPAGVEVFVDERFVPAAPPALAVHAMRPPRPVRAWDHHSREVTELVAERDGRTLASFARGRYQGIAEDHFVEVELATTAGGDAANWLVAHGWIYPTDSSINMAIGQGRAVAPRSLSLHAQDAAGRWVEVATDLGFPAGKNKTVLIDLGLLDRAGLAGAGRVRLATNLEIYWDSIGTAVGLPEATLATERLTPREAVLAHRGFSRPEPGRRDLPEIPLYDRIANTTPRWRDLVGHYTRFGDVRELVAEVEDRYVIMNAGDELRLSFPAPPPPPAGWARDFVLIGDGWNKDGDFNTSHSKTVVPLPSHDDPSAYASSAEPPPLIEDPVFHRHREDWQTYHTRYVAPRAFLDGLWAIDGDPGDRPESER